MHCVISKHYCLLHTGMAGKEWYDGFRARHPGLVGRKREPPPQVLDAIQASTSGEILYCT